MNLNYRVIITFRSELIQFNLYNVQNIYSMYQIVMEPLNIILFCD